MPFKNWAVGESLLAADLNSVVANQVVAVFADAPARTLAIPTPVTGQFSTRLDAPGIIEVWNGSAWVSAGGVWQSYTPVWTTFGTGAVQPTIGNGVLEGKFCMLGPKVCSVYISLAVGTTTDCGRMDMQFSLPVPSSPSVRTPLSVILSVGSLAYVGFSSAALGNTSPFGPVNSSASNFAIARNADATGAVGTGIPAVAGAVTWNGTNRFIRIAGTYETT